MKVFLSFHSDHDLDFARQLAKELRAAEILPSMINLQELHGNKLGKHIDHVLQGHSYVLVILSRAYTESSWHHLIELNAFLNYEEGQNRQVIIPIFLEECIYHPLLERRGCDFRKRDFAEAFEELKGLIVPFRQVFVIMNLNDKFLDQIYSSTIRKVIQEFGYVALRIDELLDSGIVSDQMLKYLDTSEIVLADLTGERPNCYYEAGYAHALRKELILMVKKGSVIHFDLASYRFIQWEDENDLREKLRRRLEAIVSARK